MNENKGNKEFTTFGRIFIYPISKLMRRMLPGSFVEKLARLRFMRFLAFKTKISDFEDLISIFKSRK